MRPACALLVLGLTACAGDGTGVLLRLEGSLSVDALAITAQLPDRSVTRNATFSGGLPTTYLAKLPDEDAEVSFLVRAHLAGVVVAERSTDSIAVAAHQVTEVTLRFDGGDADLGVQDGGAGFVVQRGGAPPSGPALSSVFGFGSSEAYVTSVSSGGANLLHTTNRGADWSAQGVGPAAPALFAGWGAGPSSLVLVGENGTLLRGGPGSLTPQAHPAGTRSLRAVWGTSPTDVYVVGDGNTILHSVIGGWVVQTPVGARSLQAIWGSDASHLWAVGSEGAILFSTGNGVWTLQPSGTTATLRAISGRSGSDVYVVGDGGTILHWSGSSWSAETSPRPGVALYGLHQHASGAVIAVGEDWTILRSAGGGSWTGVPSGLASGDPSATRLAGVWVSAMNEIYVVGAGQTILRSSL